MGHVSKHYFITHFFFRFVMKIYFYFQGVGEPPLLLASSVFFAIKAAISAFRADNGIHGYFPMGAPATPERIRMNCADTLLQLASS